MSASRTSARVPDVQGFVARDDGSRPTGAASWMAAGFLVSLTLAAIVLAVFGAGESGTALALRVTARWCFVLFWPAYAGAALAKICGARFDALARHGRTFGLAFAAALSVHVGLVLWINLIAADQRAPMLFFWAGVFCAYALALFSIPRLRELLGPTLWRALCALALEYIALVFAVDFIVEPLHDRGVGEYPLSYLPFVVALAGGAALRLVVHARRLRGARSVNKA